MTRRRWAVVAVALVGVAAVVVALAVALPRSSRPSGPTRVVQVTDFGATAGDGTDDGPSIQRALDSLRAGEELAFAPGTYEHSTSLRVGVAGVTVEGTGATLTATDESDSSFKIDADDVVVQGMTFGVVPTSRRIPGRQRDKVWISGHSGDVLRDVTVTGSAAAGIAVGEGAGNFRIERATVRDTRADGIHMTDGVHDGVVDHPTVSGSGDDGVAVVSYQRDSAPCARITVESPRVVDQVRGRGLSVVGGEDIAYNDVDVESSNSAAVYIAVEGDPFFTRDVSGVTVQGGRLVGSNKDAAVNHGAVLVFLGAATAQISDVQVKDLTISDTRTTAGADVSVRSAAGQVPTGLVFSGLQISGGPARTYGGNVPASQYRTES